MKKNYSAFILAALVIPATGLLAQGRGGGRAGGGGRPGGASVQPGGARPGGGAFNPGQPGGARPGGGAFNPGQPGGARPGGGAFNPGGPVPGERRLGGAVVIPGGRPGVRPLDPPQPPPPPTGGPVVVTPEFFDPLLPGYGSYGYRHGRVIVVPPSVIVTEPDVVQQEVVTETETVTTPVPAVEVKTEEKTAVAAAPVKAGDFQLVLLEDDSEDATPAVCYKAGEEMKFTFSVNKLAQNPVEGKLFLKWKRSGDDGKVEQGRTEISAGQALTLATSIDRPGFVRIEASLEDEAGHDLKSKFDGGAGAEIEKLTQAVPEPEDFDAYWTKQKEQLAAVAATPELKKIKAKQDGFDAYEVKIPCAGPRPVTGYLVIPSGAEAKSLPAKVHFQAYGVRDQAVPDGVPGMVYFDVNAHGIELSRPKSYYDGIRAQLGHYAYNNEENKTPDTSYFRYMAARVIRAFDFVKTVSAWNGKDLGVIGYSQGGLQAAWAAGLVPEITHAEIGMPWCSDVGCAKAGRQRGTCPDYQPGLDYFDPVNHIKRAPATCLVDIVRAGLGDYVAQPSGVAVLFNNAPGKKRVIYYQNCAHAEPNALSTPVVMRTEDWPEPDEK
ncbi:MAG: acetylxylan esterase [Lentisphaeria bacterium]|nr:acetylxylan esterase [Lentisphaeria bacterium]